MPQPMLGKASVVLHAADAHPEERTYVTFGLERGGTSPVAGIQRALGLYLGPIKGGNNEDDSFHNKSLKRMRDTIEERNAAHQVWGFKYPNAGNYLPTLIRSLRNPYFVVVFRDPVATALSRARWDGDLIRRSPRMALHEASANSNANLSFALASLRPTMLVSTERVEKHASELVDEVADFMGVPRADEVYRDRILAYLEPGSYKKFEDHFPERAAEEQRVADGADA